MVQRNVAETSPGMAYAAFACEFPLGAEWVYRGVRFDGFQEVGCMLKEAKEHYKQFLDKKNPGTWAKWFEDGRLALLDQARRQVAAAQPRPPVCLVWFFHELEVMMVLGGAFQMDPELATITCFYKPMPELQGNP